MKTETGILTAALLLGAIAAHGADIPYSFETLPVPRLISMNERNERAAWTAPQSCTPTGDCTNAAGVKSVYTNAKGQDQVFECGLITPSYLGDTFPSKINGKGEISGLCVSGDFTTRVGVGFIREPSKGRLTVVQVPGAANTDLMGINNRGQAVGQYHDPLDFNRSGFFGYHGFLWDNGKIVTIDVPVTNSVTTLLGIDDAGRILGQYFTFDPATNETSAAVSFLYDNGQFTVIKFPGSTFSDAWDINRLGQVIGMSDLGVFFYDDGNFYTVQPPTGFRIGSVDNIDDDGRIVGRYLDITKCNDFGCPSQTFLATQMVRGKSGKMIVDMRSK